jgi:cell division protein FtsB
VSPRAVILLVVVCIMLTFVVAPARSYLEQRSLLESMQARERQLYQENARLEARLRQLNDPTYLERLARECLGMVRPGEIAFVTVPKKGSPTPPDC